MCHQIFHPLIRALNFRGTGHKLRSRVDGLSWCLPCVPVLVAKDRNSPLGAHITEGIAYLFFIFVLLVMVFFPLCTLWIFIAVASVLLSADLPLTSVGVLLLERVWNAQLRAPWCCWRENFALSFLYTPGFRFLSSLYFNLAFSCLCLVIVNFDFGVAPLFSLNFSCAVLVCLVLREVLSGVVFPLSQ